MNIKRKPKYKIEATEAGYFRILAKTRFSWEGLDTAATFEEAEKRVKNMVHAVVYDQNGKRL